MVTEQYENYFDLFRSLSPSNVVEIRNRETVEKKISKSNWMKTESKYSERSSTFDQRITLQNKCEEKVDRRIAPA